MTSLCNLRQWSVDHGNTQTSLSLNPSNDHIIWAAKCFVNFYRYTSQRQSSQLPIKDFNKIMRFTDKV